MGGVGSFYCRFYICRGGGDGGWREWVRGDELKFFRGFVFLKYGVVRFLEKYVLFILKIIIIIILYFYNI